MKLFFLLFLLLGITKNSFAQSPPVKLNGLVRDAHSLKTLSYTLVGIDELNLNTVTDSTGFFEFRSINKGSYHLTFSHFNCEPQRLYVSLVKDTFVIVEIEHHNENGYEKNEEKVATIVAKKNPSPTQNKFIITNDELRRDAGSNFSTIVAQAPGVGLIKNGSGITKPIIHGMYGNRLTIVNNGIALVGQKWGNDHAPEIDPFSAAQITVIKGASSIQYGDNSLGGVILVEPSNIKKDPHIHGSAQYVFNSNGMGNTVSTTLEKSYKTFDACIVATYKKSGDKTSPTYFLTNTGNEEKNFSLMLQKQHKKNWNSKLYYSYFNTTIGILKGALLSNLTDLNNAITRDTPFFTNNYFSYTINEPKQKVSHHFLNYNTKYAFNGYNSLHINLASQVNIRKEFDVRRNGKSNTPVLNMLLASQFIETKHLYKKSKTDITTGLQYKLNYNNNNPETGINPLIPNYVLHNGSLYSILQHNANNNIFEIGLRYDKLNWIIRENNKLELLYNQFNNFSSTVGYKYTGLKNTSIKYNIGITQRSPEINELYSNGLHQGVASLEQGNKNLNAEVGIKNILSLNTTIKSKLFTEISPYYYYIKDYIFLEPQKQYVLTVRGAFPLFIYKQTDAAIKGLDFYAKYEPTENLEITSKASWVRGNDISNNTYLIYMPSDNYKLQALYTYNKFTKIKDVKMGFNALYVAKQNRLTSNQDFLAAPNAYTLFGMLLESNLLFKKSDMHITLQIDNILNTKYRDYLNRLRYFANEEGVGARLGIKYDF